MKTSENITEIIITEINGKWGRSNLHNVNIRDSLITPEKIKSIDTEDKEVEVWLVLLENPQARLGYGIAYDETSGEFGLLQFAEGYEPFLIGLYGTFFDALDAM
jgi:hypothetical protein